MSLDVQELGGSFHYLFKGSNIWLIFHTFMWENSPPVSFLPTSRTGSFCIRATDRENLREKLCLKHGPPSLLIQRKQWELQALRHQSDWATEGLSHVLQHAPRQQPAPVNPQASTPTEPRNWVLATSGERKNLGSLQISYHLPRSSAPMLGTGRYKLWLTEPF